MKRFRQILIEEVDQQLATVGGGLAGVGQVDVQFRFSCVPDYAGGNASSEPCARGRGGSLCALYEWLHNVF